MANEELYILSVVILITIVIILHILVKLFSFLLHKKYGVKLKIRSYGFMCFRNIQLHLNNGLKLEIEYIGVSSCYVNSNLKSPIVVCILDVRLQGDADWIASKTSMNKSESHGSSVKGIKYISFLRFISIHVSNASVMQLGKSDEEFLLHLSFQEFNVNFTRRSDCFNTHTSIQAASIKILKHLPIDQEEHCPNESCICHFSANFDFTIQVSHSKKVEAESLRLDVSNPELMLYEGFSIAKFEKYIKNILRVKPQEDPLQLESALERDIQDMFTTGFNILEVSVHSFSVKLMMEGGHRTFRLGVQFVSLFLEVSPSSVLSKVTVKEITAATDYAQFAQMHMCELQANVVEKNVILAFKLSYFHTLYQKEVLEYFLRAFIPNTDVSPQRKPNLRKRRYKDGYCFKCDIAIDDICVSLDIPGCDTFSVGLIKGQSKLHHFMDVKNAPQDPYGFQNAGECGYEVLVDTAYLKLGSCSFSDFGVLKKYHHSCIPISVGMALTKTYFNGKEVRIHCMADDGHLQWCPDTHRLLRHLLTNLTSRGPKEDSSSVGFVLDVNLKGLNLFAVCDHGPGIVFRADKLGLISSSEKKKLHLEGFKSHSIPSLLKVYPCVQSSEMKTYDAFLEDMHIIYTIKSKDLTFCISTNMYLNWTSNIHMTLFTLFQEYLAFKKTLLSPNADNLLNDSCDTNVDIKKSKSLSISIQADGALQVGFVLSRRHRTVFSSNHISLNFHNQMISGTSDSLVWAFDDHKIFVFDNIQLSLVPGTEEHRVCRQGFDDLELYSNRLLSIQFEEVKFLFPYKYNFAEAFSEEFINVVKWIKILHRKQKVPFTLETKLPPDLSIVCKVWTIELEDDPFEVKLRDNFELLEDEYQEGLKRKRILDEKIESVRRINLLLPTEKIQRLYSSLARKDAEIYVLRSQQMYANAQRTALCVWTLDRVDITAIADPTYHGTQRVVDHIRRLDPESPYPEDGLEFTTLWARKIRCSASSWTLQMRDFPQMPLHIREMHVWGFVIGAEQEASHRARRRSTLEIDAPWGDATLERSMPSLKFYHDLTFDLEEMSMAYGPSWEPVMAQVSLAMEYVSRPSLDPSPALSWWDKMRLLSHGRLTLISQHLNLYLRASLDPYNTTEHMELSWSHVFIESTKGKILTKGDLDMYVHTASKYDDIRVLHIPHLKLSINFNWCCLGNPFDHHNVMPCAPDKIPEYSINQEHDSYRAFRSQHLNVSLSLETRNAPSSPDDVPEMLLYSSTLRWIENLKMILSGVTRLTRRGVLFRNTRPRKPQLSRHYSRLSVSLNLHRFRILYWMSFARQRGLEVMGGRLALSSQHTQHLQRIKDGLTHRPRANWNIEYLNCELSNSEMWLYNCMDEESENPTKSFSKQVEKSYFLSVDRVSYGREEIVKDVVSEEEETPTHRLVVHALKGAWTRHNRLVIFSLLDSYQKTVLLKKNLSTEALRCFKGESTTTPPKMRSASTVSNLSAAPSPISNLQSSHAASMLQKLVAEAETNNIVFTEEIEATTREQQLHGISACQTDDVLQKKWLIELVNSQVMLRGCETSGYVIVSAAKAKILQRLHTPVWKDRSLVSKTTWVGSFDCMQYYATVDAGEASPAVDDILWLSVDNISERDSLVISDLPDLVGSGHSAGGVVSNTVGSAADPDSAPTQLQRIVSRCGCQFFFASYGENMDPATLEEVPPLPSEEKEVWSSSEVGVDCFTLTHHDLEMCTNSLQYAMILDVLNNLLLHVESGRREHTERLQCMRFQLQLCSSDDQRGPILQLQENIRSLVSNLRRLEKEAYVIHKLILENPDRRDFLEELDRLDNKMYDHKEELNSMNEELTLMISCFKETQIIASRSRQRASSQEKGVTPSRRSEVCFKHAQWRLTDADGQLGIADITLSNFLYSKVTKTDDSVEHLLEVSYVKMANLLPNQAYKIVLQPTELSSKIPLERQCLLRIFCREMAPVGGISIKDHLEVNVVPITIGLTEPFYRAMLKFFFPGRDTDKGEEEDEESSGTLNRKTATFKQKTTSMFYGENDAIEKMKERAAKNHTFISIKIPEVPIRVSYKGRKEKNLEDVHELSLLLPTLEYHNKTWTWLDLLMALKNDAKSTLVSQAIKQKFLKSKNIPDRDNQPQEDEKAMILLGTHHLAGQEKSSKTKGLLSKIRKDRH